MSEPALAPLPLGLVLEDGEPLDNEWHTYELPLLRTLIRQVMTERGRTDFYTGVNQFLYYSVQQAREVAEEVAKNLDRRDQKDGSGATNSGCSSAFGTVLWKVKSVTGSGSSGPTGASCRLVMRRRISGPRRNACEPKPRRPSWRACGLCLKSAAEAEPRSPISNAAKNSVPASGAF